MFTPWTEPAPRSINFAETLASGNLRANDASLLHPRGLYTHGGDPRGSMSPSSLSLDQTRERRTRKRDLVVRDCNAPTFRGVLIAASGTNVERKLQWNRFTRVACPVASLSLPLSPFLPALLAFGLVKIVNPNDIPNARRVNFTATRTPTSGKISFQRIASPSRSGWFSGFLDRGSTRRGKEILANRVDRFDRARIGRL